MVREGIWSVTEHISLTGMVSWVWVGIYKGTSTTCHCTSMPLIRSSHSRFPREESLDIQHHGTYTQLNLLNSFISPMSGCGKGGKGLGKGGPSITAKFFVTKSKLSLISIIVLVTHFQSRHCKARYSLSCLS